MSYVFSRNTLRLAVTIGVLASVPIAGTAASQGFPSRTDQVKRHAEEARKDRPKSAEDEQSRGTPSKEKSVAEKAAHYERVHRERMARIRRLLAIYREKGDREKVAELQAMQDKLDKRHVNAMKGFREQLGKERWTQVEKHLGGPSARALEVRNERANENAAERDARKAGKESETRIEKKVPEEKIEVRPRTEKPKEPRSKEKPPGGNGGGR